MKKSLQVQINKPCHENWGNMIPDEQGRFCGSCQKTVVDFTNMTDEELLKWVTRSGKDMCGRFNNDQLQRDLIIYPEKKFSFKYVWQLMIAGFLIAGKSQAQGAPILVETTVKKPVGSNQYPLMGDTVIISKKKFAISGFIVDSSNNSPVAYASLYVKGTSIGVQSDSLGKFFFEYGKDQNEVVLEISSVGYATRSIVILKGDNPENLHVLLTPSADLLGEVSVTGYETIRCRSTTGLLTYVSVSRSGSVFDTLFSFRKDIVVYPNPVARGSSINFSLNLKQTGQYKLELVDAAGKLLLSKSITVANVKQQESITTSPSWSKGIYYLKISQPGKKFNKTTKVLLQ